MRIPVLYKCLDNADVLFSKGQLSVLFGIGIIVVAITIIRIPLIFMSSVTQSSRSLVRHVEFWSVSWLTYSQQWASIEILCACVVANAAFFYAIVKDLQSRSHSHSSSSNMPSNDFYLQSLQSTSRAPNERKREEDVVAEQIDLEESRPPSGNGSDHSLWTGLHSENKKS